MKNKSKIKLLTILSIGVAVSSCGTSANGVFGNRIKTYNGAIASHKKIKTNSEKNSLTEDVVLNNSVIVEENASSENNFVLAYESTKAIISDDAKNSEQVQQSQEQVQNVATEDVNSKPTKTNSLKTVKLSKEDLNVKKMNKKANELNANVKNNTLSNVDAETILIAILCILLPPLAVFLVKGMGTEFLISIILTLLFWLPGIIYAFIVCLL